MQTKVKGMNGILMITVLFIVLLFPLDASTVETASVTLVDYYEDGDYMHHNAQGEYEGYNLGFLQKVSKLSGLFYEVMDSPSRQEVLQFLTGGRTDILPAVYHTEGRMDQTLFTNESMCTIYTILNTRMDDNRYNYEDLDALQSMRVGIIKRGEDDESFKRCCAQNSAAFTIIEYDETQELLDAFGSRTLGGVIVTHLGRSSVFRNIAWFVPTPMYIAVSRQRLDLLTQINRSISDVLLRNPDYRADLYDKYLLPSPNQVLVLTKEEVEYIGAADEPIHISYDPSFASFPYKDVEGELNGIMAGIFARAVEKSGLDFQLEACPTTTTLRAVKLRETDAVSVVDGDYLWDERNHMNTALRFLSTPSVMTTQAGKTEIEVLVLSEGYQLPEHVAQSNPGKEI